MNISDSDTDVLERDYSHYKMGVSPAPKSLPHIHCGFHEVADFPDAFEGGSIIYLRICKFGVIPYTYVSEHFKAMFKGINVSWH